MAWRFHAIGATLSPWPCRLDGVEANWLISTQLEAGMHDRERAAEDRRPDEPEVERQVADLDPRRAVEGQRGRAREQLALGEEELPAVDQGTG